MRRATWALPSALFLMTLGGPASAGPEVSGKYKLGLPGQAPFWLLKFESKDGKLTASVVDYAKKLRIPPATIRDVHQEGDQLWVTLEVQGMAAPFHGRVPRDRSKTILGCLGLGRLTIMHLDPTQMVDLEDTYQAGKEMLANDQQNPQVFDTAPALLRQASSKGATPEEVRGWADKVFKLAEPYGNRWQRQVALSIAEAVVNQNRLAPIAVDYARRAERLLGPADDANAQIQVLDALVSALRKTDKGQEAKQLEGRIEKLEAKTDEEYLKKAPPFEPTRFSGSRKSDRLVLVELFTGAQCAPCVAADVAFDALEKTYRPADVILLQYHLNIPAPDALANADTEARQEYYGDEIRGTPTILFNGKSQAGGGGPAAAGKSKYSAYSKAIVTLLETATSAPKLRATATRKGDKVEISTEVSDLEKPGDKVRLRIALVEEQVRYVGSNQLRFHHHVVRAFPGGVNGVPLTAKAGKHTFSLDLAELRKSLSSYIDKSHSRAQSSAKRPMDFKNLHIVAFVQDDDSKEVVQATEAEVAGTALQ
jgi:hypothetical protein